MKDLSRCTYVVSDAASEMLHGAEDVQNSRVRMVVVSKENVDAPEVLFIARLLDLTHRIAFDTPL